MNNKRWNYTYILMDPYGMKQCMKLQSKDFSNTFMFLLFMQKLYGFDGLKIS